jgi:hypothetical protein
MSGKILTRMDPDPYLNERGSERLHRTSVSDPDWIRIQSGLLDPGSGFKIRIRIQEGKNDLQK